MNGMMMNYAAKHNMTLGQMADMQNEVSQFYSGLALVKGWHKEDYNKLYTNIINNKNASHAVIDQVTRGSIKDAENNWGVLGTSGVVAAMVAVEGGMPQSVGNGPKGLQLNTPEPQSFNDLARNPLSIWGKSQDEVGDILGPGWTPSKLNSGDGWKFTQDGGDGFVSFTTGNSHHPNSTYYKINGGAVGKNKVVGPGYQSTLGEKSKIYVVPNARK